MSDSSQCGARIRADVCDDNVAIAYLAAHAVVLHAGFGSEVEWQRAASPYTITESELLKKAAWVILGAGMASKVVAARFARVSAAFLDWTSAPAIVRDAAGCRRRAVRHFSHRPKIDAILTFARYLAEHGLEHVRGHLVRDPVAFLCGLPYFGPATSRHLAKNVGIQTAKPDRHLVRLALAAGYADPTQLCDAISACTGDPVAVVDLVLWRYSTLLPAATSVFSSVLFAAL